MQNDNDNNQIPWFLLFMFAIGVALVTLAWTHSPILDRPADCPVGIPEDAC
jgi:hypothetical protein